MLSSIKLAASKFKYDTEQLAAPEIRLRQSSDPAAAPPMAKIEKLNEEAATFRDSINIQNHRDKFNDVLRQAEYARLSGTVTSLDTLNEAVGSLNSEKLHRKEPDAPILEKAQLLAYKFQRHAWTTVDREAKLTNLADNVLKNGKLVRVKRAFQPSDAGRPTIDKAMDRLHDLRREIGEPREPRNRFVEDAPIAPSVAQRFATLEQKLYKAIYVGEVRGRVKAAAKISSKFGSGDPVFMLKERGRLANLLGELPPEAVAESEHASGARFASDGAPVPNNPMLEKLDRKYVVDALASLHVATNTQIDHTRITRSRLDSRLHSRLPSFPEHLSHNDGNYNDGEITTSFHAASQNITQLRRAQQFVPAYLDAHLQLLIKKALPNGPHNFEQLEAKYTTLLRPPSSSRGFDGNPFTPSPGASGSGSANVGRREDLAAQAPVAVVPNVSRGSQQPHNRRTAAVQLPAKQNPAQRADQQAVQYSHNPFAAQTREGGPAADGLHDIPLTSDANQRSSTPVSGMPPIKTAEPLIPFAPSTLRSTNATAPATAPTRTPDNIGATTSSIMASPFEQASSATAFTGQSLESPADRTALHDQSPRTSDRAGSNGGTSLEPRLSAYLTPRESPDASSRSSSLAGGEASANAMAITQHFEALIAPKLPQLPSHLVQSSESRATLDLARPAGPSPVSLAPEAAASEQPSIRVYHEPLAQGAQVAQNVPDSASDVLSAAPSSSVPLGLESASSDEIHEKVPPADHTFRIVQNLQDAYAAGGLRRANSL